MSTEIGQINGVKVHAGTSAGAAYVNKITHPPSPMSSEYQGRPDCSAPNVVLMELKAEENVPPILSFPTSASSTKTINPSSMMFIQTSGAVVMNYIFMWLADSSSTVMGWVQPQGQNAVASTQPTVTQATQPAVRSAGYNFNQWQSDIASHRKTYKSSTYYLNATNFNNQGIVTSAKFKPDIVHGTSLLGLIESHAGDYESSKSLIAAIKAACNHHGIQFKFEDDGFTFIDKDGVKLPGDSFSYQIWEWGSFTGSKGSTLPFSSQIYWNTLFPANSSELLVSSPKAATRPAREGAFVVLQQEDEIIPWISNYATSSNTPANPSGLNLSFMRYLSGSSAVYIPLFNQTTFNNTFTPLTADVPWGSLDWSYTIFEGLTVPATGPGVTLTSVPYITVKSILGLELQPRSSSSLATFQKTLPLPDDDAIKMAIGIMHARPDSLPASANDLGSIAATAMKFIPTAVTWLKEIFGKKQQEPVREKVVIQKPKKVQQSKENKKRDSDLDKRISALTSAVRAMQMQSVKSAAPATQLPSYTEGSTGRVMRKKRRPTPMPKSRTTASKLTTRQRKN